jgi:hypothetical protein
MRRLAFRPPDVSCDGKPSGVSLLVAAFKQ